MPGDDQFGVALHSRSKADNLYFLQQLGVRWYLDLESNMSQVPDGALKVGYINLPRGQQAAQDLWNSGKAEQIEDLTDAEIADLGVPTRQELRDMAQAAPGTYWYIFGEPNKNFTFITGTRFASIFHYILTQLKVGDIDAKIVSPSVLNWDYTCIGCVGFVFCDGALVTGFQCGKEWLENFIGAYFVKYPGENPPVDVWAIDAYPLDWINTPNNDPNKNFQHSAIAVEQLVGMRQYLDTIEEDSVKVYANTPIWITEIAVHVGYDSWQWVLKGTGDACSGTQVANGLCDIKPIGVYHWDNMRNYIVEILDWMDANAETYGVERWFFYKSYRDVVNIANDGYMGISLFADPDVGTAPNCLGETYRRRSLNLPPVTCDADGKPVE